MQLFEKISSEIPGHVRAYTWRLALVAWAVAFLLTGGLETSITGALLMSLGEYLGNQATHLNQENHKGMRLCWIESQQQKYPRLFQNLGLFVFGLGIWIAFHT